MKIQQNDNKPRPVPAKCQKMIWSFVSDLHCKSRMKVEVRESRSLQDTPCKLKHPNPWTFKEQERNRPPGTLLGLRGAKIQLRKIRSGGCLQVIVTNIFSPANTVIFTNDSMLFPKERDYWVLEARNAGYFLRRKIMVSSWNGFTNTRNWRVIKWHT